MNEKQQMERDRIRQETIRKAVLAADKLLLEASDGSTEELNYMTAMTAKLLMEKALGPFIADIMHYDLFGQGMTKHWKQVQQKQQQQKQRSRK